MGFVVLTAWTAGAATEVASSASMLSAAVEKNTAKIGDLLWLTLTYDLPEGGRLPEDPVVGGIENLSIIERKVLPGEIKLRFIVDQLESFQTESITLTVIDKDGNEQRIETAPVTIDVSSNLGEKPEEATLRPIQDIIPIQSRWTPFLPWAAVAVILLSFVIGWLWWRRKHRPVSILAAAVDPPHIQAEKEIDQLVADGFFEKGEVKTFYFIFSEIIRRYMESIRHFPAAEMTTEEIARHLGNTSQDQEILPLLRQADLVKFADTIPTPDRNVRDIEAARTYIRQTVPRQADVLDGQHHPEAGA
jgi:polyhydroxyalkanoate synthesis regulator phasin